MAIVYRLIVKRAVRIDVREADATAGGNFGESPDLLAYRIGDGFRREVQFQAAEICAIGIARMRPYRKLPTKRLLNRCLHGSLIAGMASAGDVDGSKRGHQRFLGAIGYGFRQLTHVAIEIDAFHSRI